MAALIYRNPLAEVIQQHVEDAAFGWTRREEALWNPGYTLAQLSQLDHRLDANLEGIELGAAVASEIAWARVQRWSTPDEAFACTYAMLCHGDNAQLEALAKHICAAPDNVPGVAAALVWAQHRGWQAAVNALVQAWLRSTSSVLQRAALPVALYQPQISGDALIAFALASEDAELRQAALQAAGDWQLHACQAQVLAALHDTDQRCQESAALTLILLGQMVTMPAPQLQTQGAASHRALMLWSHTCPEPAFQQWLNQPPETPAQSRQRLWAVAYRGDAADLPWLGEQAEHADSLALAAYAVSHITGLDIDSLPEQELDADTEQQLPTPHREDNALSRPEPQVLQAWLMTQAVNLQAGQRYLGGEPVQAGRALNEHVPMPQYWHQQMINALHSPTGALAQADAPRLPTDNPQ